MKPKPGLPQNVRLSEWLGRTFWYAMSGLQVLRPLCWKCGEYFPEWNYPLVSTILGKFDNRLTTCKSFSGRVDDGAAKARKI